MSLAVITHPGQANAYGTLHGGVILRLADECGAIVALRHAGAGRIATAAIDSFVFLGPIHIGERVELDGTVTYVGRTSIECRIVIFAEPMERAQPRRVGEGYGLYVALDDAGRPRPVPPLLSETAADHVRDVAAQRRQADRLARREAARQAT
jgi:acyl-CoA hydrolase